MKTKGTAGSFRQPLPQEKTRCRKPGRRPVDSLEVMPQKPVLEPLPAEEKDNSGTIHAEKPLRPVPLPPPQEPIY